ncbi:hypothetical protein BV898_17953 [Hypsibius exemplaris]|uniref:non-specific serine/threonine protein kinase n=1 Tax=Hypsibius exemplaris TaxID=2072580 RepID=A0A9X6RN17_HYPEX|nr:hypothetical protein BV898_17953 [Hypsibius exemplaris]
MPDELKVLAGHCLKVNPDDRPTATTLLNYADGASLMLKAFDLRQITATAMVHDGDRRSGTFMYKFKDCFSDLKFGFRIIPAGYVHRFTAHGSLGYISTVDAFYLYDGNPIAENAGNQACRLLFEFVRDARSNELKSLLQLKHPNILQYIVIGYAINRWIQNRNHYCLLMEWCSGITLRDFIESNPTHCSTERVVKYTTQVAFGLHYLHEGNDTAKFVHGDITSSNIMMKESTGENLRIIDIEGAFQQPRGLRPSKKEFNMQKRINMGKGSFYFMSPEMAEWITYGCVIMDMYFASQEQALWPDHDYDSFRSALQSEHPLTPRVPENLPNELKVLARQCLQVNPSDRPTAATLLNYVAGVYFKCAEDGIHYYLPASKETACGGTLKQAAAAETALPVEKQKNYVNQLICGIHYLHMEVNPPIVHKDLKGMNVVFSDENKTVLKICDIDSCSVSRRVEQQSVISRVRFTPGFVSPELLKWATMFRVTGDYPVGRATDIWSLGAVILEMYCRGSLPDIPSFQHGDILRTTAIADANVNIPPIEQELLALAAKCLVNEPGDRPSIEQLRDNFLKGFSPSTFIGAQYTQSGCGLDSVVEFTPSRLPL